MSRLLPACAVPAVVEATVATTETVMTAVANFETAARWQQAYPADRGRAWETNWVMEYRRAEAR